MIFLQKQERDVLLLPWIWNFAAPDAYPGAMKKDCEF
jgi:hypothetical protein